MNINVLVGYNTAIIFFLNLLFPVNTRGMKAKSTHTWTEPLNDTVQISESIQSKFNILS